MNVDSYGQVKHTHETLVRHVWELEAQVEQQAATIERMREWYRAETDCRNSGDIIVNFWDATTTKRLDRRREAYAAITAADTGEAE